MMVVVTMVIIVMSVVENLKEELTESHLLASEQRSARCSDRGSVALHGGVLVAIASVLLPLVAAAAILLLLHPPVPVLPAPPEQRLHFFQISNFSSVFLALDHQLSCHQ